MGPLPFVIGAWIIGRILENMNGPRIETAVRENLQFYGVRLDLWERWEETFILSKIGPSEKVERNG